MSGTFNRLSRNLILTTSTSLTTNVGFCALVHAHLSSAHAFSHTCPLGHVEIVPKPNIFISCSYHHNTVDALTCEVEVILAILSVG